MLEEKGNVPVVGVVPYMELSLEDEDSLTGRFDRKAEKTIDIAVIRYPRISNFTDFNIFEQMEEVSVRYVASVQELHSPDMIILPGSKNTMGDLKWMRQNGLEVAIKKRVGDTPIFGICGGFQMLGESVLDTEGVEEGGTIRGLGLLKIKTNLQKEKVRLQASGQLNKIEGIFSSLSDMEYVGYEIHMGQTYMDGGEKIDIDKVIVSDGDKNVYGTYLHGIFDKGEIAAEVVRSLAEKKGISLIDTEIEDYQSFKEKQYDKLADILREYLDMDKIYGMLKDANIKDN
jgi:adenosylcobyric acid synthase